MLVGALSNVAQLVSSSYYYSTSTTDDAAGLFGLGAFWFIYCCCFGIFFLIWVGATYWVYTDAQKRNVESPILWALLTFFFSWLGLLLYFLIGRNPK